MKKIFTIAAALLASFSLWAQDTKVYTFDDDVELATDWTVVTDVPSGGTAECKITQSIGGGFAVKEGNYLGLAYLNKSNIGITVTTTETYDNISAISIDAVAGDNSKPTFAAYIVTETGDVEVFAAIGSRDGFATGGTNKWGNKSVTLENPVSGKLKIVTVASSSGKYAAMDNITITYEAGSVTPSTDPVESAIINGENACVLGGSVELTCTADKATTYQWYLGGAAIDGATAKKYVFTPTAAGTFSFTCAASNEYTVTPVVSAAFEVTVSDPAAACGELIKAVLNGGTSATMSGVLGGTFDTNLGSGKYKLDKGKYIGIQLASGSFMAGDVVTITMTVKGENYPCLFGDKERTNCLFLATEVSEALEYQITLPAAATGLTSLYLSRDADDATYKWNPIVASISVTRSCEASSNADIKKVWVMAGSEEQTFEPEEDGVTYNLVVPASVEMTELSINYTLAHPKATADVASPFVVAVPAAGAAANSQTVVVTAQDGTKKTYTFNVTKSAAASTDASLKSLSVEGYTLDPAFASDVYTYTITKAYGAENPGTNKVSCEPNDPTAHDNIQAGENSLIVTVTAEDGKTQLVYTINIVEAAAKKDLLEATFSNGVHGFISNGNINVPYLAGEAEPTFVSAKFWNADGEPTAEMVNGNLVVTGIDGQTAEYTITYQPLTPMTTSYDEITFDGVPDYIYSVYGWAEDKGVKFSKDVEEATNHRISEGKDRIYIALPVAKEVILTSGSGGARPVIITVNGKVRDIEKTAASGGTITIPLVAQEGANLVGIESKGNNGDAGFIKLQLVEGTGTAIENTDAAVKAVKVVRDGQMMILKNGVLYNMQGAVVK